MILWCVRKLLRAAGRWIIIATLIPASLSGAEPILLPGTNSLVRDLGGGMFQVGAVRLHKASRTVYFLAEVNLRDGPIEYILVSTSGKTHESLLRTAAEPLHIQLAFLLLGAAGAGTNVLPEDPAEMIPGQRLRVALAWSEGAKTNVVGAETFVLDRKAGTVAGAGQWVYTGSRLREGGFAAQLDGSIVSLITDADALVNNSRAGREDDDNWLVRTNGLPELHAPVEVRLQLLP